jgi:hypothetical protein
VDGELLPGAHQLGAEQELLERGNPKRRDQNQQGEDDEELDEGEARRFAGNPPPICDRSP